MAQVPALQSGVAPLQTTPQVPQFWVSVSVFTQAAPQAVVPLPQVSATHRPAEQAWPLPQAVPQAPQFAGSVWRLAQAAAVPLPQAV